MSTTVSGNIKDLSTTAVSTNCFLRFILRGLNGNIPRVNGTALIANGSQGSGLTWIYDFTPNASGVISGTLYSTRDNAGTGNGEIEAGGSLTAVWYGMVLYNNGIPGPEIPVHAKLSATLDPSNETPITTTPVVTAPSGDTTYLRLDAGNISSSVNPYPFPGVLAAATGFRLTGGNMTAGRVLRANGTNFVSAQLAAADLSDGTNGTGSISMSNSPALVTPSLGVATATSINGLHIASSTGTITIVNGKTLTIDNSLEFAGTDGVKHTLSATTPAGGVLSYGRPTVQIFTSSGTLTIATGVTCLKATVIGGGGAGGGANAGGGGGGGGAGGTAIKWLTGLTPGNTIVVTIGAGGTGVSAGNGNGGGNSTIASGTQTITTVTGGGGNGGFGTNGVGNGGGTASNGDLNAPGGPGANAIGSAGSGPGGSSSLGGGGSPAGGSTAGNAGGLYGGGGSGAGGGASNAGGAGASGAVIFEWVA